LLDVEEDSDIIPILEIIAEITRLKYEVNANFILNLFDRLANQYNVSEKQIKSVDFIESGYG
jgi:hypothetical protein